MAEMQRKREDKKEKKKTSEILEEIIEEVTKPRLEEEIETQRIIEEIKSSETDQIKRKAAIQRERLEIRTLASTEVKEPKTLTLEPGKVDPRVKLILPSWVSKPWRWMIPENPQHKEQWLTTWGEFLLDFARVLNMHVIDLQEISLVYPFHNQLLKKKLTIPQLVVIAEYLIELNKARWWDENKTRLRVYWKTLKTFSEELYEYAFQNGYDMVTTMDIVKMRQSWSSLPRKDIYNIMKLLVDSKKASWADSDRKTIEFHYD
ncbi:MAG: hypothetical protein ACTSW1_08115 [Candidatus Hodarchaeales archaeon]